MMQLKSGGRLLRHFNNAMRVFPQIIFWNIKINQWRGTNREIF